MKAIIERLSPERLRVWQRYHTMIELHGHKPAVLVPQRNTLPLDTAKPS